VRVLPGVVRGGGDVFSGYSDQGVFGERNGGGDRGGGDVDRSCAYDAISRGRV